MYDRERFLDSLIDLASHNDLEMLLADALEKVAKATSAIIAFVELYDELDQHKNPRYWRGVHCSCDDVALIRSHASRGIIGRAIAEGRTINIPCALTDARFDDLSSVKQNEIGAALCVPMGMESTLGVIYLQRSSRHKAFESWSCSAAERLAQQLAPLVERLLTRAGSNGVTLPKEIEALTQRRVTDALHRHDWNVSKTARSLGIDRKLVYRIISRYKTNGSVP